jgi:hypothetical protein
MTAKTLYDTEVHFRQVAFAQVEVVAALRRDFRRRKMAEIKHGSVQGI